MQNPDTDKLAEKIAKLITDGSGSSDLSSLRRSIDKINDRLDKLESPFSAPRPDHPSQDRFAIAEAIVDSLFDRDTKEKACTFETSKPCDHCSMCNSRGF